MALLYRMGTGNGSGGDIKPYEIKFTCASGYVGQTVTMHYLGTETVADVSGTVTSDGTLTLYPMHSGNWKCSCYSSVTSLTMEKNIELTYWGITNVSFEDIPDGSTVSPTNNVQTWLHCANIWDKSYTTISQVVSDTTTLSALFLNSNANNYLVRSINFGSDLCANDSAMTLIGTNNSLSNMLLNDSSWVSFIGNSDYFERVLNVSIPASPSSSNAFCTSSFTGYPAINAFSVTPYDSSNVSGWISSGSDATVAIGYTFDRQVRITKLALRMTVDNPSARFPYTDISYDIQGSNTSTTSGFVNINNTSFSATAYNLYENSCVNANTYKYYRVKFNKPTMVTQGQKYAVTRVKFYGREDV